MSLAESIANALGGVKKTGDGYLCKCPCHDDKTSSLSLKSGDKGIVLNCFAGCSWQDIKAEIERRGLLKKNPKTQHDACHTTKYDKYAGAKFYVYKDIVGNILCRKVKLPSKKMWFERYEHNAWIAGLAGQTIPLYNLQAVLAADIVYLCEGEKDAESIIAAGFCGTTNHAGATSWADHLTEQLKNKTVIIIPDNDEAGKKRVNILAKALQGVTKELRVFMPDNVPEHGDITDWIQNGGDPVTIFQLSTVIQKGPAVKKATRQEYYQLFDSVLNNPRRCIFNEKLMHYDDATNLWNPCINSLEIVKSEALMLNETREAKFSMASIQPHFFAYESTKPMEFLVDIPAWDGTNRIGAMAHLMKLKPQAGITNNAFAELLMEWCGLVFKRLEDPYVQNRILVLQGGQGIGKDTWTSMLVDGLGQFSIPLAVVKEDKDTYLNLHRGLIMKISEFDKTAKTEVSTLKDIITAPSTNLRAPYDKDSKLRLSRCSFISSANAENLLRDPTGNRRFLIFEIDSIDYAYAGWSKEKIKDFQMQCLAQMQHLCTTDYKASPEAWRLMREYIEKQTPSEYAQDITDQFIAECRSSTSLALSANQELDPLNVHVRGIISYVAKQNQLRYGIVKNMIQSKIGVFRRVGTRRYWTFQIPHEHNQEPVKPEPQPDNDDLLTVDYHV